MAHFWVTAAVFTVLASGLTTGAYGCPAEFDSVGSTCLFVQPQAAYPMFGPVRYTWPEAQERCLNKSDAQWAVDLSSNFDIDKLRLVHDYFTEQDVPYSTFPGHYVGAKSVGGKWQWLDGTPIDPKSYIWFHTMPYNTTADQYGALAGFTSRLYLAVKDVYDATSFICEATPKAA